MKALAGSIGNILFWVFAVLVFFWTASLSLASLQVILPGDPIKPYIGLILTDIGALCWLLVFIGQAKGLGQRSISLIMFVIDIAGVILLSAYHLLTGGQKLTDVPAELGNAVIYGVIGLTIVNLLAAYIYHLMEPETWKSIEFGVLTDRIQKEALQQAQRNIEAEAQKLGAIISARATAELKYQLRLPLNDNETTVLTQDAQSSQIPASQMILDAPAQTTEQSPAVPAWMFWKKGKKPIPSPIAPGPAETVVYEHASPPVKQNPLPGRADFELAASILPGIAPYRACPKCGDIVPLTQKHCAACGHEMSDVKKWTEPTQEQPPAAYPFPTPASDQPAA